MCHKINRVYDYHREKKSHGFFLKRIEKQLKHTRQQQQMYRTHDMRSLFGVDHFCMNPRDTHHFNAR